MQELFRQVGVGFIRTVVPLAVAYLSQLALVKQLGVTEDQLAYALGLAFAAAYWLAVRIFEVYVSPRFGRLLGTGSAPVYMNGDTAADIVNAAKR